MASLFDIIVVTCNLPEYFLPCIRSINQTGVLNAFGRLIIVNNGKQPVQEQLVRWNNTVVLTPGENVGWEGALHLALQHSQAPFVVFQNDDTLIPKSDINFYHKMLVPFQDRTVAAVGPSTTVASGIQSIYHPQSPWVPREVRWLIFFTVMLRRSMVDAVGGIDTMLPGGDDFDLSIRLRQAGHKLVYTPDAFLIHHGFQTGTKVHGDHTVSGGWNSPEMITRTNQALICKHGFRTFFETMSNQLIETSSVSMDKEGDVVRSMLNGEASVLELGCGAIKTVPHARGVDIAPAGVLVNDCETRVSAADLVADVTKQLPVDSESCDAIIARHIFEHCLDTVQTLRQWRRVLRPGGKLVLAVPDEDVLHGIPLNPEHCHAFSSGSLKTLVESVGFRQLHSQPSGNSISFVSCFEKIDVYH